MKVLLISPVPPPNGGIATWTKMVLASDYAKTHTIDLVNTAVEGKRVDNLAQKSFCSEISRTIRILKAVYQSQKNKKYEIVHLNSPCSTLGLIRDYLCACLVKRETKLVVHFRCDISYMVTSTTAKYFLNKLCKKANLLLVLNSISKAYLKQRLGYESTIIANFIDVKEINLKKKLEIRDHIQDVLYMGHVTKSKGCDAIIALAALEPAITFHFVGYLSDDIKKMSKPTNVIFHGEKSKVDAFAFMERTDLFMFLTHTEGFPNVITEAMAHGLPIISTKVGAIGDMLEDVGGIYVEKDDIAMCKNVLEELDSKGIREKMSEWNREKVSNSYTKDVVLRNLFQIYKDILA